MTVSLNYGHMILKMWNIIFYLTVLLIGLIVVYRLAEYLRRRCGSCKPCLTCTDSLSSAGFELSKKDSLDDHLSILTRKLAAKESKLRLSKSKIRQTQSEIENLHAIDQDVQMRYREIMESLKKDLLGNEKDCKLLQQQIEWVSRRRAELKSQVVEGQNMYTDAVTELARGLRDVQRQARPIPEVSPPQGACACRPDPAAQLWAAFEKQERSLTSLRQRAASRD